MRRAALLFALVTIVASSASPAAAHHVPADCTSNNANLTISSNRTIVRPGDTITYTVMATNFGAGSCNVTLDVGLRLPGPTGAPGSTVVPLTPAPTVYAAGTGSTLVGNANYVVAVNAGVTKVTAQVEGTGVLHDSAADNDASQNKTLATSATQPKLGFTFGATPVTGFAPFTTTYEFVVSNTSTTNVPMDPPTIQHTSCPATYASGDANSNGDLDNTENWRYTCTRLFPGPLVFTSSATARAMSTVDARNVLAPTSQLLKVTAARPPAATLNLTRSAFPAIGPAPLTVTHSYTLRNDSGADPRPVKDVTITDALCSPVVRTDGGDSLLAAGEAWTYSCTQTLATPQTVSGTAIANGIDDLGFSTASSSNQAGMEVIATGVNPAPTPAPTATPAPDTDTNTDTDTDTDTDPASTPSKRVNLATTSGRLARPCGKTATARLKVGKRLIASKRVRLDSRCRYRVRFTNVTRSRLRGATRVSVTVRSGRRTATHRVSVPKR